MKEFDIVIIGRGVIGTLAALAATRAKLKVLLVGQKQNLNATGRSSRSYALSPSSIDLIEKLVRTNTDHLEHQNISSMYIETEKGNFTLSAKDAKKKYLARMVNHTSLMNFISGFEKGGSVELIENKPESISYKNTEDGERVLLEFKNEKNPLKVSSKLVIGADGVSSWVRQKAGIFWGIKSYSQKAIVAEILPQKKHHGTASQWFHKGGILALLPCCDGNLSLVWSVSSNFADKIVNEPKDVLQDYLNELSQGTYGTLALNSKPLSIPLSMTYADSYYGRRIALLGDSAHTVHPLAGLGLNLGVYDLISLIDNGEWFKASEENFFDPGEKLKLKNFHLNRVKKVPPVQFSLDLLVMIFGLTGTFANSVRGFGMNYIDNFPLIKRNIIRQAHTVF